ncbi:MAG: SDR family oxidoreductase [Bacteroidota bacterium]|jgi:NAD(P)-dependent dehydrogenase (short-subunit alcohol dehydrogenase family)
MTSGKICLITGATSGIGKATALSLARQGATVLLVSRNKEKGGKVRNEIVEKTGNEGVRLYIADLSSQKEIRSLAGEIRTNHPRIDVLVNNAGGIFDKRILTVDGIELTLAVNHLAYFLLTNLLLEMLRAAPSARVVSVSSQAHQFGRMEFGDLGYEQGYNPMKSYARSKLANILFTYELARRTAGTRITANTLHPGTVRTNFGKQLSGIAGFVFKQLDVFMRSPEKGAETVIWLASAEEVDGVSGKYFRDKKEIRSSKISYDEDVAQRLWEASAKMTAL